MLTALEAGAEDISDNEDGTWEVLTEANACEDVATALTEAGMEVTNDEVLFVPDLRVDVSGKEAAQLAAHARTRSMNCDDVQGLTHNA